MLYSKGVENSCSARRRPVSVREAKVFKTSVRGGRSHLIVQLRSGEVAFYVSSNADWINAITSLRKELSG